MTTIDLTPPDSRPLDSMGVGSMASAATLLDVLDRNASVHVGVRSHVLALGLEPLDRVLGGGLRLHDLLIMAGRPGVGKTIAALQMARNIALGGNTSVFACYEHDPNTLLARLLAMEIGSLDAPLTNWYRMDGVRNLLDDIVAGDIALSSTSADPIMRAALSRLQEYAHRLHFVRAAPSETGIEELRGVLDRIEERPTVLFVDYLQKVRPHLETSTHLEHVSRVTAGLKEIALGSQCAVVAISAVGASGLLRRRAHLAHLDGAVAVGYDADVMILLNDKRSIVAKNRIANTLEQSDSFRHRVVFTVEKNRGGIAPVNVEFVKEFERFRFLPVGGYVNEQLIEDGDDDDFRS